MIILLINNVMSVIKVLWPGCQTASAKRNLSSVQRLACFVITGAMRNNPSNAVEEYLCLPHRSGWLSVRLIQLRIDSGVWDVGLTYNPTKDTAVFWYLISVLTLWIKHTSLNPNRVLTCWQGSTGLKQLVLLLQSTSSSGLQMVPIWVRGPVLESMGNREDEGSAFP